MIWAKHIVLLNNWSLFLLCLKKTTFWCPSPCHYFSIHLLCCSPKAIKCRGFCFFFMWPGNYLTCFHLQFIRSFGSKICVYLQGIEKHRALNFLCRHKGKWKSPHGGLIPFAAECERCGFLLFLFQLSQGSPEPIEPTFFTADYHLLHHSTDGNHLSPNDPTGNGLQHRQSGFHQELYCLGP